MMNGFLKTKAKFALCTLTWMITENQVIINDRHINILY